MTFPEKLSLHRRASGYTQQQLADILGVDRTHVWKWENGLSKPRAKWFPKMAEALGVDAVYLIREDDQ